jgi:hypothetical protein
MTKEEGLAFDLALEALEGIHPGNMTPMAEEYWNKAITAIKQARSAQVLAVQEPVGEWVGSRSKDSDPKRIAWKPGYVMSAKVGDKIYTTPPAAQRQWVGLTDEEISEAYNAASQKALYRMGPTREDVYEAIEAKLKEKNT